MITFIAGLTLGTTLILLGAVWYLLRLTRVLDIERKLFINKALVREGQAKIFTNVADAGHDAAPKPAGSVRSPFQSGLDRLRDRVQTEIRQENGSHLPNEIKQAIIKAKEANE